MKRILTLALICMAPAFSAHAESANRWTATSSTAMAITGDIAIEPGKSIEFANGVRMKTETVAEKDGSTVLRIKDNATTALEQGNTLCGAKSEEDDQKPTFMILQPTDANLHISVYSGEQAPVILAKDAKPAEKEKAEEKICATYSYTK